jgi:BlaI family transcriptional regulator, penicillinase repressor
MARSRTPQHLPRRERQILEIIYELGEASVSDVLERLPDPPSYSAVRTIMRLLENKGCLRHRRVLTKYVYRPTQSRESASRSALVHVLKTFFSGSAPDAVAAILDATADDLTDDDLRRLEQIVDKAKKEGQ